MLRPDALIESGNSALASRRVRLETLKEERASLSGQRRELPATATPRPKAASAAGDQAVEEERAARANTPNCISAGIPQGTCRIIATAHRQL